MSEGISTERGLVPVKIVDEMRGAYLDYAMSVIIGRALPDVRDGLKPVHRRALYAMYDLGNSHDKRYVKSARVVGEVIGKYHPHGDIAVYDTIVRLAQDFSLRYPLVDGQGNFGSVDGDSAAAMRYTEIRMAKITQELHADLDKETVDFTPNYDGTLTEPTVFPSRIPNLLINGSSGIAVGMATNIPPHNLTEVVDAAIALIREPGISIEKILDFIKGPDFPTGAHLFSGEGLRNIYRTGRGTIRLRAKSEIETHKGDRERIVVTEIPYQVNKAKLIEKIADLVRDKKIEGISDLRDESDRTGMRIVIELKKGENSHVLLNRLYALTQLQESYGVNMLAIQNKQPKVFNIKDMIWAFIEHRKEVVIRRTQYDLKKAEARAHILAGLKIAVENLDAVVALIRGSINPDEAKRGLIAQFGLSEIQAKEILEMRLQRLTGLERDKIINEYTQILGLIESLKKILASDQLVFEIIETELLEIKKDYPSTRKTELIYDESMDFEIEDLIADDPCLVTITRQGYIKRSDPDLFRSQNRGGKGVRAVNTAEDDVVTAVYHTSAHSSLLCITNLGKLYTLKVYKVPEATRVAKGKAIVNLISLQGDEKIEAILPIKSFSENEFLVFATRKGTVKKTNLSEYKNVRTNGLNAILIDEGDQLITAKISKGTDDVFMFSHQGMSIRFSEEDIRPTGRSSYGVRGMTLDDGDAVVAMEVFKSGQENSEILTITEGGYGKRTPVSDYRIQGRAGRGIIALKTTDKRGNLVSAVHVTAVNDLMLISNRGQMIRIRVGEISEQGRAAQGVRLMNVAEGEKVVAVELLTESTGVMDGQEPTIQ